MSDDLRPADHPNDLLAYDVCDPIHDAGTKLTATVSQTIDGDLLTTSGDNGVHFVVEGPQVALQPDDILGVYPAPGSEESPVNFLPHVALRRRTLPWERSGPIAGSPWLALLLIDDSELGGRTLRTVPVSALESGLANRMTSKLGIAADTQVTVIDLPTQLLARILPQEQDLALLVHMRSLLSDSPLRQLDDDGDVAIVIGNRLPNTIASGQPGPLQHAFLISVEGRDDLWSLPQSATPAPTTTTTTTTTASASKIPLRMAATRPVAVEAAKSPSSSKVVDTRLSSTRITAEILEGMTKVPKVPMVATVSVVVLHHWSFRCAEGGDFEEVIKDIRFADNGGVLRFGKLPRRKDNSVIGSLVTPQGRLSEPIDYPQVPGDGAIYRGPLLPHRPATRADVFAVRARPDEFTAIGLPSTPIERSDLIAFELGRLLALSDESVLAAMQQIQPHLVPPELPELLAVDPRPPALRWPETVIDPSPEIWQDVVGKWSKPGGVSLLDKAGLANKATDLGGVQKLLEQQPGLLADVSQKLAKMGQLDVGGISTGAIDVGQLDVSQLDLEFGALINIAGS